MTIRGSLNTFSLPELFQIIESGSKSGRLSFTPDFEKDSSKVQGVGVYELWFDQGNFVLVVNSMNYQSLIADIRDNDWIDLKILIKAQQSCPENSPFGACLQQQELLDESQIDSLFQNQLNTIRELFKIDRAWFKFEEIDPSDGISQEEFLWQEMTGRQKRPAELSIEAMRDLGDWQRFEEDLPTAISGLQKLTREHQMQLTSLEEKVWNYADGTVALKTIARELSTSLEEIQQIALSMILAGIVEEVPVANAAFQTAIPKVASQTALAANSNVAFKPAVKSEVSNSLINNLVSFLKNNF